jgi:hypothetical protein
MGAPVEPGGLIFEEGAGAVACARDGSALPSSTLASPLLHAPCPEIDTAAFTSSEARARAIATAQDGA